MVLCGAFNKHYFTLVQLCNIVYFMANHNKIGHFGEEIAYNYLLNNDYQILAKNWRWGKAEIDLIAQWNNTLVFVEVKTLTHTQFGYPEQSVHPQKQALLYQAASEYLYQIQHEEEFRFDIISIVLEPQIEIKHFIDAFFPDWTN